MVFFFDLQRIRELEDRIDLQKRQIKEIEEKVPRGNICLLRLRNVESYLTMFNPTLSLSLSLHSFFFSFSMLFL